VQERENHVGNHAHQSNMHVKATSQELNKSSSIKEKPKQPISMQTKEKQIP
jgi:hypothetical protein